MKFWIFLLLCLASSLALAQDDQRPSDSDSTFRVNVRLVNLFTSVTNQQGGPVGGLTRDNFQIFEDGAPQKIAVFQRSSAVPLSIVLGIDTSLSTRKDLKLELEAAKRFVHATVRPEVDALSLYTISDEVKQIVPFTGDLKRIDRSIADIHADSATALFDALYLAGDTLKARKGRKVVVLITDGGDTTSRTSYKDAVRSTLDAEAIVYSIIVVPIESNAGRNTGGEHALMQVSDDTGGRFYYAKDIDEISHAFTQISDELRTQYLLAYYPSKKLSDSDFRSIELKLVDVPGDDKDRLVAHYRTGYYTH